MAWVVDRTDIGIERTGETVTVPDNDVARLMYYLDCVCTAVQYEQDAEIRRFTNYNNWFYLSIDDHETLVRLCYKLSPELLEQVFVHSDVLCGDSGNDFLKISEVRKQMVETETIIILGQTRQINKIMVYKMSWMKRNCYGPMKRLVDRLTGPVAPPRHPVVKPFQPALPHTPLIIPVSSAPAQSNRRKWIISIVVVIVILIILGNIVGRLL